MAEPTLTPVSLSVSFDVPPVVLVPPNARPQPRRVACCLCLCNVLCSLFKLIVFVTIVLLLTQLILWLLFQPNKLNVHVENATLTQFNLTTATTTNYNNLFYNLSLNISVRNTNRNVGVYYDSVVAIAIYDDIKFGFQTLPSFYQGHKNTTVLNPVLSGQGLLFADDMPARYATEKAEGYYNIELMVHAIVRFKAGIIQTNHIKSKFDCRVRLPAPAAGKLKPPPAFQRTKCDVDY